MANPNDALHKKTMNGFSLTDIAFALPYKITRTNETACIFVNGRNAFSLIKNINKTSNKNIDFNEFKLNPSSFGIHTLHEGQWVELTDLNIPGKLEQSKFLDLLKRLNKNSNKSAIKTLSEISGVSQKVFDRWVLPIYSEYFSAPNDLIMDFLYWCILESKYTNGATRRLWLKPAFINEYAHKHPTLVSTTEKSLRLHHGIYRVLDSRTKTFVYFSGRSFSEIKQKTSSFNVEPDEIERLHNGSWTEIGRTGLYNQHWIDLLKKCYIISANHPSHKTIEKSKIEIFSGILNVDKRRLSCLLDESIESYEYSIIPNKQLFFWMANQLCHKNIISQNEINNLISNKVGD